MVSTKMSSIDAIAGRDLGVAGRNGCRWRQKRTVSKTSGLHKILQRTGSSMMILRVRRFKSP